jgi:quercetin dioxygenase-like cupin family protein
MEHRMIPKPLQPHVVRPQDGPTYRVVHDLVTVKARAADTNGLYALFETQTEPGQGMRPYCHRYEDEACWILDGWYTFQIAKEELVLGPGSYIAIPRGTVHAYTNRGPGHARMLVLVTPGGIRERFYAQVGERIANPAAVVQGGYAPDWPTLRRVAETYGIEILS